VYVCFGFFFAGYLLLVLFSTLPVGGWIQRLDQPQPVLLSELGGMPGWLSWLSVRLLTLDFSSGYDLKVVRSSPALGYTLGMEHV